MKKKSLLSFIWKVFRIYMNLSKRERDEFNKMAIDGDEVGMHFFLKHHWRAI